MGNELVLLVQADADSREMYAWYFQSQGLRPMVAATAREALTVAPRVEAIVTGMLLPGDIDGVGLIRRLKCDDRTAGIPVVVVTSCAWRGEQDRAEAAGCDAFLAKPCLPDDLVREVRRLLALSSLAGVRGAQLKAPAPRRTAAATPLIRRGKG
jgi:two-component system, cell cycle response regulator DivK